jgi:hypothetical protein
MTDDQRQLLSLWGRPPARLNAEQVAWTLNFAAHDIPILVAARLLEPLGSPAPNAVKYFATVDVLELAADRVWLARATHALQRYWHQKNRRRTQGSAPPSRRDPALVLPVRATARRALACPSHHE